MHAHKVSTATLNICGALDRCTPSEEARQFHSALVENGVESILVTYPEEGHGVRKLRASLITLPGFIFPEVWRYLASTRSAADTHALAIVAAKRAFAVSGEQTLLHARFSACPES